MSDQSTNGGSSARPSGVDGSNDRQHSIGEVLTLLQADFPDVSISKIRFLETRGLVTPHRAPSGYRKFVGADIDRLRWILTMQRDHFLPLRVIKERIDSGELDTPAASAGVPTHNDANASAAPPAAMAGASSELGTATGASGRFRNRPPDDDLSLDEFARLSGLSATQIDDLLKFGLIEPHDTDDGARYTRDELQVAKAAGGFLRHGIEARHLRAWRIAAEREAGMLEQIVAPVARQGDDAATRQACEVADSLIDLGNRIREAIIVKTLRDGLGLESG